MQFTCRRASLPHRWSDTIIFTERKRAIVVAVHGGTSTRTAPGDRRSGVRAVVNQIPGAQHGVGHGKGVQRERVCMKIGDEQHAHANRRKLRRRGELFFRPPAGYEGGMASEKDPRPAGVDGAADNPALEDDGTEDLTEGGRDIVDD